MDFYSQLTFPAVGMVQDNHRRKHRPRYYGIQFNESGHFRLRIDEGKIWELSGAWVFITHPGTLFEYELDPAERHFYRYICFYGPRVRQYLSGGLLPLTPRPIRIRQAEKFSDSAARLKDFFENYNTPRAIWQLEDLLLQLREESFSRQETSSQLISPIARLVSQILLHPETNWDFSMEAEKIRISIQHFRRLFHNQTGNSPQQFVISRRLEKAARLLRESQLELKEISMNCGIDDPFYFSALFKKKFHLPPGAYRREFSKTP